MRLESEEHPQIVAISRLRSTLKGKSPRTLVGLGRKSAMDDFQGFVDSPLHSWTISFWVYNILQWYTLITP